MVSEPVLSPEMSLAIIAFLLSLLPAGLFIWLWYLRRQDRSVPAKSIALAFFTGIALVWPAFKLEDLSEQFWFIVSPGTVHYFAGALLPLQHPLDILFPALATFVIVALVEEGLRYIALRTWIWRSRVIDQVADGLMVGVAMGLGFATLENTIYFLGLFQDGSYDTLVFVFFLRFVVSTIAHISFGGIMGAFLTRGLFNIYNRPTFTWPAFFIPWFLHGLYDLLLGIDKSFFAVLLLLVPLSAVVRWGSKREFFAIHRKNGQLLAAQESPLPSAETGAAKKSVWNMPVS
ncbi:MAG: PrsW family intramembrane metalloprotease [Candidatus Andersenbacteria bacterium]|nr:PrsW family intramembrane metalloprotease [Candidatus Andersenbacteria bacterium]